MASPQEPAPVGDTSPREESGGFAATLQGLARAVCVFMAIQYAVRYFSAPQSPVTSFAPGDSTASKVLDNTTVTPQVVPLWPVDTVVDLAVYVSDQEQWDPTESPVWAYDTLTIGDWAVDLQDTKMIAIPVSVQHNASLFAHIVMDRHTPSVTGLPEPTFDPSIDRLYLRHQLNRYRTSKMASTKRHLLQVAHDDTTVAPKSENGAPDPSLPPPILSHWSGNLTLNLLTETKPLPYSQLPPPVQKRIPLEPSGQRDPVTHQRYYTPLLHVNQFWDLTSQQSPINTTTPHLPLTLRFYPLSLFKYQLYITLEDQMSRQMAMLGSGHGEFDEFKRMLVETSPWLLTITALVSVLHSVFDFLAFKNDIAFWKGKKGAAGISVRAIVTNVGFQVIIFLYLLDNQESTSWMILVSQGVGLLIEVWKIKKAVDIQVDPVAAAPLPPTDAVSPTVTRRMTAFTLLGYRVTVKDKAALSKEESKTRKYDQMAFKYLSYVAYPLLVAYAGYSVVYDAHKSWYSFVINTLVGYVYTFGFITMTPQLFINYKLKSVAHMPWRTFMYKALNTFVDDLFAFIITMPTLHRLACLRDDAVFLVYLYQRWIYPMDPNRANEFGQVAKDAPAQPGMDNQSTDPAESKKTQ
ncbi:hypothetical protein H4R34_001836 [Dimargaris verticillata]|uniref:Cleft lip and palate transmembrane protein 1-domain-containing protein n=1 Tax=Dimargaris verticillata TaxID=2761393 RepID=A0A9W8BAK6_9FUNG|nr:hypothetical protein H4R34_001836 [Dimargaris verticillata]